MTVLGNHCADFIDDPKARMGVIDGNPINRDMERAARMAKLAYIVNVVVNEAHEVVAAFAGDPIEAHRAGCAYLARYCEVEQKAKGRYCHNVERRRSARPERLPGRQGAHDPRPTPRRTEPRS